MRQALYFMAHGALPLDSVSMDPPTSYMGETPTVYPGSYAFGIPQYSSGQANPAIEDQLNQWMNVYMNETPVQQTAEENGLKAQEAAGTLDELGVRKLKFIRSMTGEFAPPPLTPQEIASAVPVDAMVVKGSAPNRLPMFVALAALLGVAAVAAGRSRG